MAIVNPIGTEFRVNTTVDRSQQDQKITTLANGNFVVAFTSQPGGYDILAQIFDPTGTPIGVEFMVNTSTANNQFFPDIVGLSNGGFIAVWVSPASDPTSIKGQIFNAGGGKVGPEFAINNIPGTAQYLPLVCELEDGNILVAWQDRDVVGAYSIKAQLFNAAGNEVRSAFAITQSTDGFSNLSSIASLEGGGFAVASNEQSLGVLRSRVQIFDASGTPVSDVLPLGFGQDAQTFYAVLAPRTEGGFIAAWTHSYDRLDYSAESTTDVYAQIFDADGTPISDAFRVNTTSGFAQVSGDIQVLSDGNFVIAWTDLNPSGPDASSFSVRAQLFDALGSAIGTEFLINTTTTGYQSDPQITALANSGFAVSWGGESDIWAQVFQFAGNGSSGDGKANIVLGTAGNDELAANGGDDTAYGASGNDRIGGGGGDDDIWAGAGHDRLESGSGIDELHGELGADRLFFGATLTSDDIADGGPGSDTLFLHGDYANLVFGAATVTGIETILLARGFSYRLVTHDATVAGRSTLTVDGSRLLPGQTLYFDGSAETAANSRFVIAGGLGGDTLGGGAGRDELYGGNGIDTLFGYSGDDRLSGGRGHDRIVPGNGADIIAYTEALGSSSRAYDTIVGFDASADRFSLPVAVSGIDAAITSGRLSETQLNDDLAAAADAAHLAAGHAVLFTPDRGAHAGETFLIVDANGVAGYQGREDFVFQLEGAVNLGGLTPDDFI